MRIGLEMQTHQLYVSMFVIAFSIAVGSCFDSNTENAPPSLKTTPPTENPLPTAGDDTLSVPNNRSGIVSVLDNDTSTIGNLIIDSYDQVSANGGSVSYNGDGTFTYVAPANFEDEDTFNYTVVDEANNTATATVVVTVSSQVIPNGQAYYAQNCAVCHSAGSEDTSNAFNATDLVLVANPLKRDMTLYGGEYQLMGAFYDIPQPKVDELKAYISTQVP